MSSTFAPLEIAYTDRLAGARQWKQAGGKVAGFVSTAVPVELIEAAGIYPVMVTGNCRIGAPLADVWMETLFDPMARAIFQSALAGELEFLDVLIVPRTADSFMRLYLYLREAERQGLSARLPRRIVLYDLLQSPGIDSAKHNLAQLRKLSDCLIEIAAQRIDDSALRSAIVASNVVRRAQQDLLQRRRADQSINGICVLKSIGARYLMRAGDYATSLRAWLDSLPQSPPATGKPRALVAGNAQDNESLHGLLDRCGLHVAGDYHWLGDACAESISIAGNDDPWQALSRHYHLHILSSRRFPHPPGDIVAHANTCGAQGVVFYLFEAEEALTWDCPNQVRALEAAGIATVVLENQPYVAAASPDVIAQLRAFEKRLNGAAP